MERTICECARFTFPDKISRRDILYKFCGHPTKWKECPFKLAMDGFYERKYASEQNADKNGSNDVKRPSLIKDGRINVSK